MNLRSGSSKESELVGVDIQKKIFANNLIAGSKGDTVELSEETVEPLSSGWKMIIFFFVGIGEPSGSINNEIQEISAKTNEVLTIIGEFAE